MDYFVRYPQHIANSYQRHQNSNKDVSMLLMQDLERKQHHRRQTDRECIIKQSIANQPHPTRKFRIIVCVNGDYNHKNQQKYEEDQEDNKRISEDACISVVIDELRRRKSIRSDIDHIPAYHK